MIHVQIQDGLFQSTALSQINTNFIAERWRHRILANGGFDTASFEIKDKQGTLEEMFLNGLGRKVTRYFRNGHTPMFEGQIVEMTLSMGGAHFRTSLNEMWNSVAVRYIPIDTSVNPPTESAETRTDFADDLVSQARYGNKQTVFRPPKINRLTAVAAEQYRDVLLEEYKNPRMSQPGADFGSASNPRLGIVVEGFVNALNWRVYNEGGISGTQLVNLEIADIVTATGGLFVPSTDLDTTTTVVQRYYSRDDTSLDIIRAAVNLGQGTNRWLFYVLEDRVLKFKLAPIALGYTRRILGKRQEIRDASGRVVPFSEVRPGNWLKTVDVFKGELVKSTTLRDDPRCMFIESVEFSDPDTLALTGAVGEQTQVLVARAANRGDNLL